MIDAIVNNGESPEAAPKKIFQSKKMTSAKKIDYSKMIGPSSDEEIPSTPKKMFPLKKKAKKIKPRKIDYSEMISDEESDESEKRRRPKKRRRYSSDSDEGRPLSPPAAGTFDDINEDELPLPPKIQSLPGNQEELCARANALFKEFRRGK